LFFNAVWALTSGGFRIVSDSLVNDVISGMSNATWTIHMFYARDSMTSLQWRQAG